MMLVMQISDVVGENVFISGELTGRVVVIDGPYTSHKMHQLFGKVEFDII